MCWWWSKTVSFEGVSKPLKFTDDTWGPIETKTYDNTYGGRMNLVRATLKSDNSVYMQLGLDVGPQATKEAARAMGIKSKLNAYPAEILGGLEDGVSPLEMANSYATIASGGMRNRPIENRWIGQRISDPDLDQATFARAQGGNPALVGIASHDFRDLTTEVDHLGRSACGGHDRGVIAGRRDFAVANRDRHDFARGWVKAGARLIQNQ